MSGSSVVYPVRNIETHRGDDIVADICKAIIAQQFNPAFETWADHQIALNQPEVNWKYQPEKILVKFNGYKLIVHYSLARRMVEYLSIDLLGDADEVIVSYPYHFGHTNWYEVIDISHQRNITLAHMAMMMTGKLNGLDMINSFEHMWEIPLVTVEVDNPEDSRICFTYRFVNADDVPVKYIKIYWIFYEQGMDALQVEVMVKGELFKYRIAYSEGMNLLPEA